MRDFLATFMLLISVKYHQSCEDTSVTSWRTMQMYRNNALLASLISVSAKIRVLKGELFLAGFLGVVQFREGSVEI